MKKPSKKNLTTQDKSVILKVCLPDDLLVNINKLTIEDLIALKLELSANNINNRLYGFNFWKQTDNIVKEALLKFAVSTTNSKKDAARFLGLTSAEFRRVYKKYNIEEYFA